MVPRLRLHSAGRLASWAVARSWEYRDHVPGVGPVARGELELRPVGCVSRGAVAGRPFRADDAATAARCANRRHVCADVRRLADFSRDGDFTTDAAFPAVAVGLDTVGTLGGSLSISARGSVLDPALDS